MIKEAVTRVKSNKKYSRSKAIRSAAISSILFVFFPFICLAEGVHSRIGSDSLLIASQAVWYLEEYDEEGRPSNATRWIDGIIAERITWFYEAKSQFPVKKIATGADSSTETQYDSDGNEKSITVTGATGEIILKTVNEWLPSNRIKTKTTVDSLGSFREEYDYSADGVLTEKRVLKDLSLIQRIEYLEGEDRIESVFKDGVRVLAVMVKDGQKSEIRDE